MLSSTSAKRQECLTICDCTSVKYTKLYQTHQPAETAAIITFFVCFLLLTCRTWINKVPPARHDADFIIIIIIKNTADTANESLKILSNI